MAETYVKGFDMSERNDVARGGQDIDRSALSAEEQQAVQKAVLSIFQRGNHPVLTFQAGSLRTVTGQRALAQNALATVTSIIEGEAAKMGDTCCKECDALRISLTHVSDIGSSRAVAGARVWR